MKTPVFLTLLRRAHDQEKGPMYLSKSLKFWFELELHLLELCF